MSQHRTTLTIKLPAHDPHSAIIVAWLVNVPAGEVSAAVRLALAMSPVVQQSDLRPHLARIEAKLDQLLARSALRIASEGGGMAAANGERSALSSTEQEALGALFDFGG